MKLISWNVNGLRACLKKGFLDFVNTAKPDVLCLQEIKMQTTHLMGLPATYYQYWNPAKRPGYAGTAVFTKVKPESVDYTIGIDEFDDEGRSITLEFEDYYLVNFYLPNSKRDLGRLELKLKWNKKIREYLKMLEKTKPVIITGDLNVAHEEIDLANPKENRKNAGFTIEERNDFKKFLAAGYIDTFREFHKDNGHYSWWSYRFKARERNIGWRIDYFLISKKLKSKLKSARILNKVMGSDHCPVELVLK